MSVIEEVTLLVVVAAVIIGLVSNFSTRLGVAAPLLLVVVGAGVSAMPWTPTFELEPDVVLVVVLPPLLYAAARRVPYVDFRRNLTVISSLAVVLVALSTVAAGLAVHHVLSGVGLALALALGAVVSPPDAVAAISLGKALGLPARVVTILEGEGLVNDATALVLLSTALGVATGSDTSATTPWRVATSFVWAVLGAVLVGLVLGRLVVWVRSRIADPVLDVAIALGIPFLAYLLAEEVGGSGVVGVVIAGLVVGNRGISRIPASRRRAEATNWASFTMLVENGVFLLMGYLLPPVVHRVRAGGNLWHVVVVGLLVSAVLVVVRFCYLPLLVLSMRHTARRKAHRHRRRVAWFQRIDLNDPRTDNPEFQQRVADGWARLERQKFDITAERDQRLGWRDSVVLSLAGMRGVVTIAGAQTLPSTHPRYHDLVLVAFVVALVTLIPQGLLLPFVVRALHLQADSDDSERQEYAQLMLKTSQVADAAIEEEIARGGVDPVIQEGFRSRLADRVRRTEAMGQRQESELLQQFRRLQKAQLEAEAIALAEERRRGEYSSEALVRAQRVLDDNQIQLEQLEASD